jgi:hypothetical protein
MRIVDPKAYGRNADSNCIIFISSFRNNDELRKDALDALCCLAYALGEDFSIFLSSINKLILKHHIRVLAFFISLRYNCYQEVPETEP